MCSVWNKRASSQGNSTRFTKFTIKDIERPVFITPDRRDDPENEIYHIVETIFPSDVEKYILEELKQGLEKKDFFALSVISYRNAIVSKVLAQKSFNMNKVFQLLRLSNIASLSIRKLRER